MCSDATAGGRHENEDIRISELECPVTTDPAEIARALNGDRGATRVVFCTYHSLRRVTEAQAHHRAPAFDLAIADEAHRTTGTVLDNHRSNSTRRVDFQEFHDETQLHARKRLYMTATPRIYTERSKGKLADRGIAVVDMGDHDVYGPELHRLAFAKAVRHRMLSDYRVIVLGVSQGSVTPGLRRRLEGLDTPTKGRQAPTTNEMTRVLGVSLAVNGVTEGETLEQPGKLTRTMAFANSIARSKWYAKALMESEVLRATTRRMHAGRAMKVVARHLDGSATALERKPRAPGVGRCRPGRRMPGGLQRESCSPRAWTCRRSTQSRSSTPETARSTSSRPSAASCGRRPASASATSSCPVVVELGRDVADALQRGADGYATVGRVLRALQAHDGRLAESPATFIKVYEQKRPGPGKTAQPDDGGDGHIQAQLELEEAEQGIYAHVAAASGLGKPGQIVADEIAEAVRRASLVLQDEEMEDPLAEALDLVAEDDGGAKGICTIRRAHALQRLPPAAPTARRTRDEKHRAA